MLFGIRLTDWLEWLPLWPWMLVLALALALGRQVGIALAGLALGVVAGVVYQAQTSGLTALDLSRPVEVVGRCFTHPSRSQRDPAVGPGESTFELRATRLRQGQRVLSLRLDLLVTFPADVDLAPTLGTQVRLRGYLRRSPGFANPEPQPGPWRLRLKSRELMAVEAPPGPLFELAGRWQRAVVAALVQQDLDRPGVALAQSLVLGDRRALPRIWQQVLQRSGLGHLLSVSGLHVGLLGWLVLTASAPLGRVGRLHLALAAVAAYQLLLGPQPAALRSSLMAGLCLGAVLFERPPQALNALSCGAAVLALWDPGWVRELSFNLSVAATAGILLLAPRIEPRFAPLGPFLRRALATTLAAQFATLPWLLPLEHGLHPLAPLANLVFIPWLTIFLSAALLFSGVALVFPAGATALAPALDWLTLPLTALSTLPPSLLFFAPLKTDAGLACLAGTVALAWGSRRLAIWLALVFLLPLSHLPEPLPRSAEVVVFDVGQGDAILFRQGGRALLVDGGGWPQGDLGGRVLLPALAALGIARLEAAVMTHPDLDHCGGLVDLVRYLPVREVWMSAGWSAPCAQELLAAPGPQFRALKRGDRLAMGSFDFAVLHPGSVLPTTENDRSLVLLAEYGKTRLLLTGDIETSAERELLRQVGSGLAAQLLKVAHHGSRTSTSALFLRQVAPRIALVSVGAHNLYGHPAEEVLSRLRDHHVLVLRSDRMGMIRLGFEPPGPIKITLPATPRSGAQ